MRGWCRVVVYMFVLLLPTGVMAQRNTLLTRQQLDSLINPAQSDKSAGTLVAKPKKIELGTIESKELIDFGFELRNTTNRPIAVTELRSSCSCIKVYTKPTTIEPYGTLQVEACFSPKGRSSSFSYTIFVYTALDNERPSERVTISGDIYCSDEWSHLPERAGALRLSRKMVTIEGHGEERIAVANSSDKPIRITTRSTVAGLTLRCEPEVLEPHSEGNIYIGYHKEPTQLNTMILLEGINCAPSERMIKVIINR